MKNSIFHLLVLAILMVASPIISNAQKGYNLSVGTRMLNMKDSTVYVLEVARAIEKDVTNSWKKSIEKNKIKAEVINDQLRVRGVRLESIDDNPLDIYSTVVQQDSSVKVYTIFIVDGERVDPYGTEGASVKVRKLLARFGSEVYMEVLKRELNVKEDRLKELSKLREKNLKRQDKNNKSIQKDSLQISSEESEIILLKGQLKNATDRYTVQKNKISNEHFATKDDFKEAKNKLKEIEKERNGIAKDIKKHSENILSLKSDIREDWYEIKGLEKDAVGLEDKLMRQRSVVLKAEEDIENNSI